MLKISFMRKNTSVSLGLHFENFISNKVNSGLYSSASEVIREALRLLEVEEKKLDYLKKELEIGENSGLNFDFDPQEHLKMLHTKHVVSK